MLQNVIYFIIFECCLLFCVGKNYTNYTLYRALPTNESQMQFFSILPEYYDMQFWREPGRVNRPVDFIISPKDQMFCYNYASGLGIQLNILLDDVQKEFDNQKICKYLSPSGLKAYTWDTYHSLDDIYRWLECIADKFPHIIEIISTGNTTEDRYIYTIVVNVKSSYSKPRVIVEGGIHGNEWISVEFVTYLLDQLTRTNVTKNTKLDLLLHKYEWYLIPVLNPDGYEYSQTIDRMWRKNRRKMGNDVGIDLNRNFDYSFGKYGTSDDPKDEHYSGLHPFSESESQSLLDLVELKQEDLTYYFSIHGYGQELIIPYSDRKSHNMDNYVEAEDAGKQAIAQMYKTTGVRYKIGTYYDTLGHYISGDTASYIKKHFDVRFVYTFLLRDNGTFGHALPPDQILSTCQETLAGLVEIMSFKYPWNRILQFSYAKADQLTGTVLIVLFSTLLNFNKYFEMYCMVLFSFLFYP